MLRFTLLVAAGCLLAGCSAAKSTHEDTAASDTTPTVASPTVVFNADSAFAYMKTQVDFGPRINNTPAHKRCADWLQAELKRHGAEVVTQPMTLQSADGVTLDALNIIGRYNPEADDRLLLLAHYDTRPWADSDPDEANRDKPVPGANDGASGVAVLLETARQMGLENPGRGIDILFVDAEDRGSHADDDSWALGAKYFAQNPFVPGYSPSQAILLDMVGARGAKFRYEGFSLENTPDLVQAFWQTAAQAGFSDVFLNEPGGAVTDDHVPLLDAGIPAIDIIEYDPSSPSGFNATWHTVRDDVPNIDPATLRAVGQTLINYIYNK